VTSNIDPVKPVWWMDRPRPIAWQSFAPDWRAGQLGADKSVKMNDNSHHETPLWLDFLRKTRSAGANLSELRGSGETA
jgi:hypothetical protein